MASCSVVNSQLPLWDVRTQWPRKGTRDSQESLTVGFWNEGDEVLFLPKREWGQNPTPSEVAFGCLFNSRHGRVCLDVLVSVVCVLFLCFLFFCHGADGDNPFVFD